MLKMNELVKQSGVSKSTILFYLKEGLLPEPNKPKPNLHLYHESVIDVLEFIKYLQQNFHCSISEIKAVFTHKDFNISAPHQSLFEILEIVMGADFSKTYTKNELCSEFMISPKNLQTYIDDGLLHTRDGKFTSKEREILSIISSSDSDEFEVIKSYAKFAKEISKKEVDIAKDKLNSNVQDKNLKHLFDIMLVLKPYIFNMQTLDTYQKEKRK